MKKMYILFYELYFSYNHFAYKVKVCFETVLSVSFFPCQFKIAFNLSFGRN